MKLDQWFVASIIADKIKTRRPNSIIVIRGGLTQKKLLLCIWKILISLILPCGERENYRCYSCSNLLNSIGMIFSKLNNYIPYEQIKGEANLFDLEYDDYFFQRKKQQMLESLKGRKSLLYLWNKQNRICPLCGKEIDCTKAWNVNEISVGGSIVRQLVHNNCYKRNKRNC